MMLKKDQKRVNFSTVVLGTGVAVAAGVLACTRVASANQVLVKTGYGLKGIFLSNGTQAAMTVHKSTIVIPILQRVDTVSLNPRTYEFDLHNMSSGKVEFNLPVAFTIGPVSPSEDPDGFYRYCERFMTMNDAEIRSTILGIIEGETRGLTSRLTVEEMFEGKDRFRNEVVSNIQADLSQFGLRIFNANIKEMTDYDENNTYFAHRKRRAIETANYNAQVDVAEAERDGRIGVAQNVRDARTRTAELNADAEVVEAAQKQREAIANADLKKVQAEQNQRILTAQYLSDVAAEKEKVIAEKDLELKRKEMELERRRALDLVVAQIEAESKIVVAEGEARAIELIANANLLKAQTEAEALRLLGEAQGKQISNVINAAGSTELAQFYLGLQDRLPQTIAEETAKAVQGMEPKVWSWNNNSEGFSGDILKTLGGLGGMMNEGMFDLSKHQPNSKTVVDSVRE